MSDLEPKEPSMTLDITDVTYHLHCSEAHVRRLIKAGKLETVPDVGLTLVRRESLVRLVNGGD